MRKQDGKKLRLDRETLAPLQADALASIAGGGAGGGAITLTFHNCPTQLPAHTCLLCMPKDAS